MSQWAQTLDALMRDRGREVYGYAYALTENRDAAEALLKESLYRTFRRGAGPATVENADAEVREAMRALAQDDRVRVVTGASASESLKEAIDAGIESLGSRDMTDVIWPAQQRARKHRRSVVLGWSAAAVTAIGCVAIAASVLGSDPTPEPSPSGIVRPAGTMDATYLIGESSNRARGSNYSGPPGLKCELGDENPHLDPSAQGVVTHDCASVWLSAELELTLTTQVSVDASAGTITMNWSIENDSYPVLMDRAGIIGVLTTGSDGLAQDVAATDTTLAATTTWTSDSTELGVLNSSEDLVVLAAGTPLQGSTTWTANASTLLDSVIAGESPFELGLQVRIGPRSDAGGTELLVSVTDDSKYTVEDGDVVSASPGN